MLASKFHINTLKEALQKQKLLVISSWFVPASPFSRWYLYLYALGLRSLRKVENIVHEEMNRAGALELLMPFVQPAELWQESGR